MLALTCGHHSGSRKARSATIDPAELSVAASKRCLREYRKKALLLLHERIAHGHKIFGLTARPGTFREEKSRLPIAHIHRALNSAN
jgi:hypothetical protein